MRPIPSCPGTNGGVGLTGQPPCAAWILDLQREWKSVTTAAFMAGYYQSEDATYSPSLTARLADYGLSARVAATLVPN